MGSLEILPGPIPAWETAKNETRAAAGPLRAGDKKIIQPVSMVSQKMK